jgi:amidohydrolase
MSLTHPDDLKATIDERVPDLVATRRDFHEHPELAFEEVRTSGIVAQRLRSLGLEVETGVAQTGVVGLLRGEKPASAKSKTLALRADMDALPIYELNEIDYRSQVDGKMHACGHDGHTAILLTVADILSKRKAELSGNVKFVFQPAEEQVSGAQPMIEAGVMQQVDGVIGLHLISTFPMGYVGVRSGAVFASANRFEITVKGKGGHAAMPNLSVDPIVIAAQIILALQSLISRETSPFSPAVVTIASVHAGSAFNIIPQEVLLQGTMRAFNEDHRQFLLQRIREVAEGISSAMRGSCEISQTDGIPPCVNDPAMTALVHQAAAATVGEDFVEAGDVVMTAGSDDMACFLEAAPGCYFIVGANNPAKDADYPHHHPRFSIDEDALPIGVEVLTRATLDFLA